MHSYDIYGLHLTSEWAIPAPEAMGVGEPDVEIRRTSPDVIGALARETERPVNRPGSRWVARRRDGSVYVSWTGLFDFLVSDDGRHIAGRPSGPASVEAFATYLLGPVLSFALLKQGMEPLHATVVEVGDKAIAFVGDSGYGKSTLAAAFLAAGHRLLTDDVLVLKKGDGGEFYAYPGPRRIKLVPEIAERFLRGLPRGTPMAPSATKRVIPLKGLEARGTPARLEAIYALPPPGARCRNRVVNVRRLSQRQACVKILASTFNPIVVEVQRLQQQLVFASDVVSNVPVKSLSYCRDLAALSAVRDAILADVT